MPVVVFICDVYTTNRTSLSNVENIFIQAKITFLIYDFYELGLTYGNTLFLFKGPRALISLLCQNWLDQAVYKYDRDLL